MSPDHIADADLRTAQGCRGVWLWTAIGYVALLVIVVVGFLLIRDAGSHLQALPATVRVPGENPHSYGSAILLHVLIALAAVIALGQVLARLFARIHQPPVIGEVVAGILLGPSLIGREWSAAILPPTAESYLGLIAQLGAILYMFLVGLEMNAGRLRHRAHATLTIAHASMLVPFLLGALVALPLYPRFATADVPFTSFALFMGLAMSITAFPVLARILTDRQMTHTELGVVALGSAAINDVTAWCMLALVVGLARAEGAQGLSVIAGTVAYVALMLVVVRPLMARLTAGWDQKSAPRAAVATVFVALLLSALATEWIGIHALFGAFLLGAIIPHDSAVAKEFSVQLERVTTVLLLPAYFAFTGMRTRIGLVSGWDQWLLCGVIILAAALGKFGGTTVAARLTGVDWRRSAALGTLMNTRGLMELIVLNIGLDLHIISPTVFAMMVLMALVTTMAAAPVLQVLLPEQATESLGRNVGIKSGLPVLGSVKDVQDMN
jgi:Kef-type K+ transport system membrane component KefB